MLYHSRILELRGWLGNPLMEIINHMSSYYNMCTQTANDQTAMMIVVMMMMMMMMNTNIDGSGMAAMNATIAAMEGALS